MSETPTDIQSHNRKELRAVGRELKLQALILGGMMALMWALVAVDYFWDGVSFRRFGIEPRTLSSLPAVLYAHVLHINPFHLIVNSVPFLVLGWFVMLRDTRDFIAVSVVSALSSGMAIWVLGWGTIRLGSGTFICGFLGCLLAWGWFERKPGSILVSLFFGLYYLGVIFSAINPLSNGSWVGCVAALVSGVAVAGFMNRRFQASVTRSMTDPE